MSYTGTNGSRATKSVRGLPGGSSHELQSGLWSMVIVGFPRPGVVRPLPFFQWFINGDGLTILANWDDPPSTSPQALFRFSWWLIFLFHVGYTKWEFTPKKGLTNG